MTVIFIKLPWGALSFTGPALNLVFETIIFFSTDAASNLIWKSKGW